MDTIIITGFGAFGNNATNPTQKLASEFNNTSSEIKVVTAILPVTFNDAFNVFEKLVNANGKKNIKAIIHLGLAENRLQLEAEKIAINWIHARIPDNNGTIITGQKIQPAGLDGIFSTLDLSLVEKTANDCQIPFGHSYSAGTYVCNYLYYQTLFHYPEIPTVFLHLPKEDKISFEDAHYFLQDLVKRLADPEWKVSP